MIIYKLIVIVLLLVILQNNKNHYCYNSYEVCLCDARIFSLYVAVTVVLVPAIYKII